MWDRWRPSHAAMSSITHGTWIMTAVASAVLIAGLTAVPGSPVRAWLAHAVADLPCSGCSRVPDRITATAPGPFVAGFANGTAATWTGSRWAWLPSLPSGYATALATDPATGQILAATNTGAVFVWYHHAWLPLPSFPSTANTTVTGLWVSPDGGTLLVATTPSTDHGARILRYRLTAQAPQYVTTYVRALVGIPVLDPQATVLAVSGSHQDNVYTWDATTQQWIAQYETTSTTNPLLMAMARTPGHVVAGMGNNAGLWVWNSAGRHWQSWKPGQNHALPFHNVAALAIQTGGTALAVVDQQAAVFTLALPFTATSTGFTSTETALPPLPEAPSGLSIRYAAYDATGQLGVASSATPGYVAIWQARAHTWRVIGSPAPTQPMTAWAGD